MTYSMHSPSVISSRGPLKGQTVLDTVEITVDQVLHMRKQPGLISAQLHRGIAGSSLFMNYMIWESAEAFRRGYELPDFQAQLKQYPPGTVVSASFFQRVAVPGMSLGEGIIAAQ